jgi:hypothetical protein
MRIGRTTTVLAVSALAVTALLPASGAGAVTAAGAAAPTARQAGSCSPSWKLVTTPTAPGPSAAVVSVSALSTRDVRFSGEVDLPRQPWALRWNGRSVAASAQIPQAPYAAQFGGAGSFDSASDGWVLAPFFPAGGVNTTAERWHDRRWTAVPLAVSPQPLTEGLAVGGLASQSARSAWAAGYFYKAAVGVPAGTAPTGALIEHWDGSQWSIVSNPAASRQGTSLHSLTVVSPTDIWAAGGQSDGRGSAIPFFEHWNGTTWSIVPAPALPATVHPAALYTLSAASSSDIWAVGGKTVQSTGLAVPLIEHWDGVKWSVVHNLPGVGNAILYGVYAASPTDVWADGQFGQGAPGVFLHWDGSTWTKTPVPGPQEFNQVSLYAGMGGTGPDNVWAVGTIQSIAYATATPQIAHLTCG